jgi:hypothetical protein
MSQPAADENGAMDRVFVLPFRSRSSGCGSWINSCRTMCCRI